MTRAAHPTAAFAVLALVLASGGVGAQCAGVPTFTAPAPYPAAGSSLTAIEKADLDGDGDLDLVACNGSQMVVMRNLGSGGFVPEPPIPAPSTVRMAVGDFDGDGAPDIAGIGTLVAVIGGATTIQGRVTVYLNRTITGSPVVTFAAPVVHPFGPQVMGGSIGRAIRVADLNADGVLDVVAVDSNSANVWILLGQGSFGIGNGTFGSPAPYPLLGTGHQDVAVADFDQDGTKDLALVQYGGSAFATFGTLLAGVAGPVGVPTGAFVPVGSFPIPGPSAAQSVEAADVNLDGSVDLVIGNYDTVVVALGGGFPFITTPYPGGAYPAQVALADLSGDGVLDVAVARNSAIGSGSGNFAILTGQTAGAFTSYTNLAVMAGFPTSLTTGDFNGDGRIDVAVAKSVNGVDVILGTCPASPTPPAVTVASPNGGELLGVGVTAPITWTKSGPVAAVDLDVSRDGGATWQPIGRTLTGPSHSWRVTPPGSHAARVRVTASGLAVSDQSDAAFGIVGPGAASATSVGFAGCPLGMPPTLSALPPTFGTTATVLVTGAGGSYPGALYASLVPPSPTPVSPGCNAHLDLGSLVEVGAFTTLPLGIWAAGAGIPVIPSLTGFAFRIQAAIAWPVPPGYALTNAVQLTLGY